MVAHFVSDFYNNSIASELYRRKIMEGKKGVALITAAAVLGIISILAVGFVQLSSLEYRTSTNYHLRSQCKILAQAGIDRAIIDLQNDVKLNGIVARNGMLESTPTVVRTLGHLAYEYEVLVKDTTCQVNINQPNSPQAMIENLCRCTGISSGEASTIAQNIVTNRPPVTIDDADCIRGGYSTLHQMKISARISEAHFAKIRPFLATHGWVNTNSLIHQANAGNPVDHIGSSQRCPINVNAASWQVLKSTFWGIRAFDGRLIDENLAERVAKYIADPGSGVRPIKSWDEFRIKLYGCPGIDPGVDEDLKLMELIFIAVTPNAHSRRHDEPSYYADYVTPKSKYDKSSVVASHTECCLGTMGCYHIESTGRVRQNGDIKEQSVYLTVVRLYEVNHVSSEARLEAVMGNSEAVITAPFAGAVQHPKIGYVKVSFFSEDDPSNPNNNTTTAPSDGNPSTAGGGGDTTVFGGSSPFEVLFKTDENGNINGAIDLRWKTAAASGEACHHLFYADGELKCISIFVPTRASAPEQKISKLVFNQAQVRGDWRQGVIDEMKLKYREIVGKYLGYELPKITVEGNKTTTIDLLEEYAEELFANEINSLKIYQGFAYANNAYMGQPLMCSAKLEKKIETTTTDEDGNETIETTTEIIDKGPFNANDYETDIDTTGGVTSYYWPYRDGIYAGGVQSGEVSRPAEHVVMGKIYREGVEPSSPVLHDQITTRWERYVSLGNIQPNSFVLLQAIPDPGIEPKFIARVLEFKVTMFSLILSIMYNIDFPILFPVLTTKSPFGPDGTVGSTLNCWYGEEFTTGIIGRGAILNPRVQEPGPQNLTGIYRATFRVPPRIKWYKIGTFRWTGYSPIAQDKDHKTSVTFAYDDKNFDQNGQQLNGGSISRDFKLNSASGDLLPVRATFHNGLQEGGDQATRRAITPFLEDMTFLAAVLPEIFVYQELFD